MDNIVVVGAGTMGSGIALAMAQYKYKTIVFDLNDNALQNAKTQIAKNLDFLLNKNKISIQQRTEIENRVSYTQDYADCVGEIIIEAIIEKEEAKISVLSALAAVNKKETILASNTSSLSISRLQENLPGPERVAGLHFFNPAQVMKLVEVVKGKETSENTINTLKSLCANINKTGVVCTDSPGFIVNRVARHFYLESLALVESGYATPEQIDTALEAAGFKMGPFKLMDLIGMDINLAVSESLYNAFDEAVRFTPSALQKEKVLSGKLGRKTGEGFYVYANSKS